MRISIRVDGSQKIGFGHLVRMTELGRLLSQFGTIEFVSRDYPEAKEFMRHQSAKVHWLRTRRKDQREAFAIADLVGPFNPDLMVLDVLEFPANYASTLRKISRRVIAFDVLGKGGGWTDGCVNALVGENTYMPLSYQCVGPQYLILRPSFCRKNIKRRTIGKSVRRSLVVMGGADPHDLSFKVADSIADLVPIIDVVLGPGYSHDTRKFRTLKGLCAIYRDLEADALAKLMSEADIAFVGGGMTVYECAAMGLPTITLAQMAHEENDNVFQKYGVTYYAGMGQSLSKTGIQRLFKRFAADRELRLSLSRAGSRLNLSTRSILSYFKRIKRELGD
jgi:UDP-2,4-diacetamido-2,4,6-trideoxy-beta-L-altropyranose hydrolase